MQDRDADLWSALASWLSQVSPLIYGAAASIILAFLRQIYDSERTWRQMAVEAVLCGAIAVVLVSALGLLGVPHSAATFVGGMVGFLGVEKVRQMAEAWIGRRIER